MFAVAAASTTATRMQPLPLVAVGVGLLERGPTTIGSSRELLGIGLVGLIAVGAVGAHLRSDRGTPKDRSGGPDPLGRTLVAAWLFLCGAGLAWWWNASSAGSGSALAELYLLTILCSSVME